MQIELNGESAALEEGESVLALLARQGIGAETKGVAVAVNAEVIPLSGWRERVLVDGDKVDVIRAVQGGS